MDEQFRSADTVFLPLQDSHGFDEEDDWVTDFDDDSEELDRFDLGAYAGALR